MIGYVTPTFEFEKQQDDYFLNARFKNLTKMGLDVGLFIINSLASSGELPDIVLPAPIITLDSVVVDLTTGTKSFALQDTLPRFDNALKSFTDQAFESGLFGNYRSVKVLSPVDFVLEGSQGKLGIKDGKEFNDIPYSYFNQSGHPKIGFIFGDESYDLTLKATDTGTFDLHVYQSKVKSSIDSVFYDDVQVIQDYTAKLKIDTTTTVNSLIVYDQNNNQVNIVTDVHDPFFFYSNWI